MKATFLFAPSSKKYSSPWSSERLNDPLQSGQAILASYLKEKITGIDVKIIGNQVVTGKKIETYRFRDRTIDEIVEYCKSSDFVAMTVLFNNLTSSIEIAEKLKLIKPNQKIILGGQGVSNPVTAKLILKHYSSIDFIVAGAGEEAILGIIKGDKLNQIPNLIYKDGPLIISTQRKTFNINDRSLWDYTLSADYESILRAFDSRNGLYKQLRIRFGNFIGRVGVQYVTGCEKANKLGPCGFCTSSQNEKIIGMDSIKFWKQVKNLYTIHGITEYFIVDNILATKEKIYALKEARKKIGLPDNIEFRAYGYVPYFLNNDKEEMLDGLKQIGVKNLFLGIESFFNKTNQLSNKPGFIFDEVYEIIKSATKKGIDLFLPIMVGLPGESAYSINYNLNCLELILQEFGKKEYGTGGVVRVDISKAMPLRGTTWFNRLSKMKEVLNYYSVFTGKNLENDIDPNYELLRIASTQFFHSTGITSDELKDGFERMQKMCLKYIRAEQVGGYEPCAG